MSQTSKGPKGPSNNHPNRNWRRTMRAASDAYLTRYRWPDGCVQMMTPEQLSALIAEAYQAGYTSGRNSVALPQAPQHANSDSRSMSNQPSPPEILAARKAAHLTQTAAADLICSRMRTWQDWESGARNMPPAKFELFKIKAAKGKK